MADFIEWQQFEELYLNIKDNDFFNTISLSRDENFNIHFCVVCKELDKKITRDNTPARGAGILSSNLRYLPSFGLLVQRSAHLTFYQKIVR